MYNKHAGALIPKTFEESKLYILRSSTHTSFLSSSSNTFRATDVLQSIAIATFLLTDFSINFNIIYSHITKLLAPVIASVPLNLLKFSFSGKLKFNSEFVAQGGFPRNNVSVSPTYFSILYVKKLSFTICNLSSDIRFLHSSQYSGFISTPTIFFIVENVFKAALIKLPKPDVGSITTSGFNLSSL